MSTPLQRILAETPIAVFDLDGTLLAGDTFLPFVISYAWKHRAIRRLLVLPMYAVARILGVVSAQRAKHGVLRAVFRGEASEQVAGHAESFCREWLTHRLRSEIGSRLRDHLRAGHRVLLVSASPDLYVTAFARFLGIPEVVCTRVAHVAGKCTGDLTSNNCKGYEKVTMLKRYLACEQPPDESYAYGDSRSDLPVLRWVKHGFFISRWSGRVVSLADSRFQSVSRP